jgi:transcriptional regulator with XRE-family HTH domain
MIYYGLVAETIGGRIKRERLKLGWTQRQLADAAKVGVPHISKVEADRENPSDELLGRLAPLFNLDVEELLIAARRVPTQMVENLAENPAKALVFLRTFGTGPKKR